MTLQSSSRLRTTGLLTALAVLWGSGFFWIKLGLEGFTPTQLTFARLALGALVLAPIVLVSRLALPRGPVIWGHLAVSALIANAIPYTLFAVAEQTTPSSIAGVINATTPLWTVIIALAAGVDRPISRQRVTSLVLGFAGAVVVLSPWTAPAGTLGGFLACAGAAASYGAAYVYQARYLTNRGFSPLVLTAAQLAIAAGMLAVTLPFGPTTKTDPSALAIAAVVILGVLGTGLALVINYTLITTEGPTTASVVTYLLPAVAVALGVAILGEPAGWSLPIGGALILLGVALARGFHG